MHLIDWAIVFSLLLTVTVFAFITKKHTKSVSDFLAANRTAGRYLLSVASGIASVGAISIVAGFEMYYKAGFSATWWQLMMVCVSLIISLSGWFFYRFRQTRALTLAQFLEIRYSKKLRIFAGVLGWLSGIINFGIFPAVGARFFIYFCGFPDTTFVYVLIMMILLLFALFFTFIGGQIAVMVTDFIQGTFCNIAFVVAVIVGLCIIDWGHIIETLTNAPQGASLLDPFKSTRIEDFNIWYYLILAFTMLYSTGVWQGNQGYHAAAINPHEARMGKILSGWRILALNSFLMIIPVCAYTFMHNPRFAQAAEQARANISNIINPQIQEQMTTIVAMKFFLPTGVMGIMAAVMLAAFIGNIDTYLHSWGSIFIQDVVLPLRKKPFAPKQHMNLLRWSILGVAFFIFVFSLVFRQTEYIYMFMMITGAIFMGGGGAVVFGGLYWKRGTTTAAWGALITGSSLAVASVIVRQIHQTSPFTGKIMSYIASQNGAILSFYSSISAVLIYIILSLTYKRAIFNMDRMLHRGKYTSIEEGENKNLPVRGFRALIGMGNEFQGRDKILYLSTIVWTLLWAGVFIIGLICNTIFDLKIGFWTTFWKYYVGLMLVLSIITTIWFTFGGILDLKKMFRLLASAKRNDLDDGFVVSGHNLDDAPGKK
ncbi:MAG: hypothetical protein A2X47_00035 [Lentisphaerae bacterium GWF2_38_69]|nr:MAG: hypothetical protein A2X47_00035 [Lentisphaerae bacterium GWF2_38_69]HBG25812.1 sodium:solute symporter [Phycisphaerales bacterium]